MRGSIHPVLTLVSTISLLAACSTDVNGPEEDLPAISAAISAAEMTGIWVEDSVIVTGDSTKVFVSSGNERSIKIEVLTFLSRSADIASVRADGTVHGLRPGSATLVLAAAGRPVDSLVVSVIPSGSGLDPEPLPDVPQPLSYRVPELPRRTVDVSEPRVTGRTYRIPANNSAALRAALDAAVGGDEIVLPNGSRFTGNFTMPVHEGGEPVILRSESVPPAGQRVTPSSSRSFARLITTNSQPALRTAPRASNWRVIGVAMELRTPFAMMNYGIVTIGTATEASMAEFSRQIVLDRVLITADVNSQTRRCIGFNGIDLAVVHSWLSECHSKGFDTQAVASWTSPGPFLIENNHMEASGEHVVFGGGDPRVPNVSPSDITIRRNYMFRPMSWANGRWLVKNIFELKHARRLLFEGNVLENNWIHGQSGSAIMLTAISQGGKAPWTTVQDLTIRNNVIKNSTTGITLASRQSWAGMVPTEPSKRILFENNLMLNVGTDPVARTRGGRYAMVMGDVEDFTLVNNTFLGVGAMTAVQLSGKSQSRLVIRDNVFGLTTYGIFGAASQEGITSLKLYARSYEFLGNVMTGRVAKSYPAGNATPASLSIGDFMNPGANDYTLKPSLPFASRAGSIVGVRGVILRDATQGVTVTR